MIVRDTISRRPNRDEYRDELKLASALGGRIGSPWQNWPDGQSSAAVASSAAAARTLFEQVSEEPFKPKPGPDVETNFH